MQIYQFEFTFADIYTPSTTPEQEVEDIEEEQEDETENNEVQLFRAETSPEIVDTVVPVESGHIPSPPIQGDILRTDPDVERSVHHVVEDQRTPQAEIDESYLEEVWYE